MAGSEDDEFHDIVDPAAVQREHSQQLRSSVPDDIDPADADAVRAEFERSAASMSSKLSPLVIAPTSTVTTNATIWNSSFSGR